MSRRLIAVCTCHARVYPPHDLGGGHKNGVGRSDTVYQTWYQDWIDQYQDKIDFKFFFGRSDRVLWENEVFLDCADDYYSLPQKVRKICEYADQAGYDEVTKIDDDVLLYVDRLLANPLESDYRGFEIESDIKYASGTCYQLSRRALKLVADAPVPDGEWREDRHVGRVLLDNGIQLENDQRFLCCSCEACMTKFDKDSLISIHTTSPSQMETFYEQR